LQEHKRARTPRICRAARHPGGNADEAADGYGLCDSFNYETSFLVVPVLWPRDHARTKIANWADDLASIVRIWCSIISLWALRRLCDRLRYPDEFRRSHDADSAPERRSAKILIAAGTKFRGRSGWSSMTAVIYTLKAHLRLSKSAKTQPTIVIARAARYTDRAGC
jgi:hypothetical protein